jgi:hypothetical protein
MVWPQVTLILTYFHALDTHVISLSSSSETDDQMVFLDVMEQAMSILKAE